MEIRLGLAEPILFEELVRILLTLFSIEAIKWLAALLYRYPLHPFTLFTSNSTPSRRAAEVLYAE